MDTWTVIKIFYIFFASHDIFFFKIIEVSKNFSITAVSLFNYFTEKPFTLPWDC